MNYEGAAMKKTKLWSHEAQEKNDEIVKKKREKKKIVCVESGMSTNIYNNGQVFWVSVSVMFLMG